MRLETIIMLAYKLVNNSRRSGLIRTYVWMGLLAISISVVDMRAAHAAQSGVFDKGTTALPSAMKFETPKTVSRDTKAVKPPRSQEFYEESAKEAKYEKLLDQEIEELYAVSQKLKRSRNRGDIWLRLAEQYVEKARLIDFRAQAEYDKQLRIYNDKKGPKPALNNRMAREYNRKAVTLYEWFVRDFPTDSKVDQALFFLGYNYFEMNDTRKGEDYYKQLVTKFPDSVFVSESYFALGEFYFENDEWAKALESYDRVIRSRKMRLTTFALYKSSWCLYRLNQTPKALKYLEKVVTNSGGPSDEGDRNSAGGRTVSKLRLANEALKDYVPFYAETGDYQNAYSEFYRVSQDEKKAMKMLERLAYIYGDAGNRAAANAVFKELIRQNPVGEKAAEYQYQVILAYATSDPKQFKEEIRIWMDSFGPTSPWARENSKNQKLVDDTGRLQELTLRNHVLQMHQSAQNSRAQFSQSAASEGYSLYFKYFPSSGKALEMAFYHAELLYDMKRYEDASKLYVFVAERDPSGPFAQRAVENNLLALEKDLPSSKEIEEKRGKSSDAFAMDPSAERFEKGADRYLKAFPKSKRSMDVRRRLGVLYYSYNQFDKANVIFEQIIKEEPSSANGEIAGNLLIDSYKIRNDIPGLADRGNVLLKSPEIAKTKFGAELRRVMEGANYARADKLAQSGDPLKAAKEYETVSSTSKSADVQMAARYKSAVNYEKGGDQANSIRMHNMVIATSTQDSKLKQIQADSHNDLARIYSQSGLLELAAKEYHLYAQLNTKDQKFVNAFYNAAVLFDGLNMANEATTDYMNYYNLSKKSDRAEVLFQVGELNWRQKLWVKAESAYEQYLAAAPNNTDHMVRALYNLAKIAERSGKRARTDEIYGRLMEMHQRLKKQGSTAAAQYAAEGRFRQAQIVYQEVRSVRFTSSPKQQEVSARRLQDLEKKYLNEMKEVIKFDSGAYIVAALASTGQMYDQMAYALSNVPVPQGATEEQFKEAQEKVLKPQIQKYQNEAKSSYAAAVAKAHDFEVFNEWQRMASEGLSRYEPSKVNVLSEIPADAKVTDWMGLL